MGVVRKHMDLGLAHLGFRVKGKGFTYLVLSREWGVDCRD